MSKTEGIFNVMGHRLDDGPYVPMLYIGPTEKQARSVSTDRFMKMLHSTPDLYARLSKGQGNKITEKFVGGYRVGFGWAGSSTELASHPAGLVMIDERDRMSGDTMGEGDPVSLARARTKNYPNKKVGVFSTPTIEGASPIAALWNEGTMARWAWACPHCDQLFIPRLELLKWPEKCKPSEAYHSTFLVCEHCGVNLFDSDKEEMNRQGKYLFHTIDEEGNEIRVDQPIKNATESFWISGLASPWVTFGEIASIMIAAYRSGDNDRIQAEINTWCGELFKIQGDAPPWSDVYDTRKDYPPNQIQPGVQFLTLGVDVQKYGLYYVVRGWGIASESHLIDNGFLTGETQYEEVWAQLANVLSANYGDMTIKRAYIDSGYRPGDKLVRPDHAVYTFCNRYRGIAFPTKGRDTMENPVRVSPIDVAISGRVMKGGIKLALINTDFFKRWVYARINWPTDEPGGWFCHNEINDDYCRQITSEEMLTKPSGRRVWIKKYKDNHYLDCEVNAIAAAHSLGVDKIRTHTEQKENKPAQPKPQPKTDISQNLNIRKRQTLF